MILALTTFPNDGRKLKNFIQGLIRSGIASCINRINYVKSYYMLEGKLKQEEEKIILIKMPVAHKDKFIEYFKKNHPNEIPELIFMKPEEVDQVYLDRIQKTTIQSNKRPK